MDLSWVRKVGTRRPTPAAISVSVVPVISFAASRASAAENRKSSDHVLDADSNRDGFDDIGAYLWSGGAIKTGGQDRLRDPRTRNRGACEHQYFIGGYPRPGVHTDESQILTQIIMNTGANYVIVATPN
jgi:hypothetical protein